MSHYELLLGGSSQTIVCDTFGQLENSRASEIKVTGILDFGVSLEVSEHDITSGCWLLPDAGSDDGRLFGLSTYDGLLALVDADEQVVRHWVGCPDVGFERIAPLHHHGEAGAGAGRKGGANADNILIAAAQTGVFCFDSALNRTQKLYDVAATHVTTSQAHAAVGFPGSREIAVLPFEGEAPSGFGTELRLPFPLGRGDLAALELSALKTNVAAGMQDGDISVYDLTSRNRLFSVSRHQELCAVTFSPHHGDLLISAATSGAVHFSDMRVNKPEIKQMNTKTPLSSLAYCPDGVRLAFGTMEQGVLLCDLRKASEPVVPGFLAHEPVCFLSWSGKRSREEARRRGSVASRRREIRGIAEPEGDHGGRSPGAESPSPNRRAANSLEAMGMAAGAEAGSSPRLQFSTGAGFPVRGNGNNRKNFVGELFDLSGAGPSVMNNSISLTGKRLVQQREEAGGPHDRLGRIGAKDEVSSVNIGSVVGSVAGIGGSASQGRILGGGGGRKFLESDEFLGGGERDDVLAPGNSSTSKPPPARSATNDGGGGELEGVPRGLSGQIHAQLQEASAAAASARAERAASLEVCEPPQDSNFSSLPFPTNFPTTAARNSTSSPGDQVVPDEDLLRTAIREVFREELDLAKRELQEEMRESFQDLAFDMSRQFHEQQMELESAIADLKSTMSKIVLRGSGMGGT